MGDSKTVMMGESQNAAAGGHRLTSAAGPSAQSLQLAARCHPPASSLPRVVVSEHLLPTLHDYINRFLEQHGLDTEAGGMLVGQYFRNEGRPLFKISGFIEAGPAAQFSPDSILFDTEYQFRMLQAIRMEHPRMGNMGCIHVHPEKMDKCSAGDYLTDLEAVRASDTKGLVFAIITVDNFRRDALSLFYRNFKIDFFVLAEQTGYEYLQVPPELEDSAVVEPAAALARLSLSRGSEISRDWSALRRIRAIEKFCVRLVERGWVRLTALLRDLRTRIEVLIREDGALKVTLVEHDGKESEFRGLWEVPEVGRNVRLSHVVLLALARLTGRSANAEVSLGRHHSGPPGLLGDKRRLVAEVRAMEERYGARAVLRCRGDNLFWEYTVVESGRRFPLEVRYPRRYPFEAPRIISLLPLPSSPHQLVNNELCWINRSAGEWNPARDTAVTCINAAHRWFACLLVYLTLGQWPEEANEECLRPV